MVTTAPACSSAVHFFVIVVYKKAKQNLLLSEFVQLLLPVLFADSVICQMYSAQQADATMLIAGCVGGCQKHTPVCVCTRDNTGSCCFGSRVPGDKPTLWAHSRKFLLWDKGNHSLCLHSQVVQNSICMAL